MRVCNHTLCVIARLDRAIQYLETVVIESIGRGVLDSPPSRGMTVLLGGRSCRPLAPSFNHNQVS
jgi:hypothetical protein